MNDPEARALARQYTEPLLKKLRGYGLTRAPEPTVSPPAPTITDSPTPIGVAETAPTYRASSSTMPHRSPTPAPAANLLHRRTHERPAAKAVPTPIPTVGERLRHTSKLVGQLVEQAEKTNHLTQVFRAYLPQHLHDHALLIRMDQEAWEVHTDSASWATRLRYAMHNIHLVLSQHLGIALPKPRILVKPPLIPSPIQRPTAPPPQENANPLKVTVYDSPDERLNAALARLEARICHSASEPVAYPSPTTRSTPDGLPHLPEQSPRKSG